MSRLLTIATFLLATPFVASAGTEAIFNFIAADSSVVYNVGTGEGGEVISILIAEDPNNPGFPNKVAGWNMGNMTDSPFVQVTEIEVGDYLQTINDGDGPDFFAATVLPDGFTVGCVYDILGFTECSYEVPKEVVKITVLTVAGALVGDEDGATADMTWVDTLGTPAVMNMLQADNVSATVALDDGVISLVPQTALEWTRGDADGDGTFNALADGLFILDHGFLGGPPPPCLEAADADGDSTLNGLADALYVLTHGFLGGPPPPPPYPSCGSDPDPATNLGCDVGTCP